jgi:hypothetical protein
VCGRGEACWNERCGKLRHATALLEDISASGAGLQLEMPVPSGIDIRWTSPRKEFRASVHHCVYHEMGYFVGVEFEPTSRWSQRAFKPQLVRSSDSDRKIADGAVA